MDDATASQLFIKGLEQGDLDKIRAVPKGDLHHHSWMGGRLAYVEERLGRFYTLAILIFEKLLFYKAETRRGAWAITEMVKLLNALS